MIGDKALGVTTFTSILLVLIAFYYNGSSRLQPQNDLQERLRNILDAMIQIETSHEIGNRKVAVGYGGCQDLFVKGSHLLQDETPPASTRHYGYIENMEQLKELYAMFFSSGSAVERFVSNATLFEKLVKKAEESEDSYYAMGGNAPVMAKRFDREGLKVVLGAKRDKELLLGMGNVTGERRFYLNQVKSQLKSQSPSTLIHFEMASFSDSELLLELKNDVLPHVDSLGMNEQELPNLYSLLKFNNVSVIADQNPRIAQVLDNMREIYRYHETNRAMVGGRMLSRIHVHTLAFQAIMTDQRGSWKNTKAAATKAALVAHRHVCSKEKVKVHRSNLLMDEGFSLSTHPNTGRIVFDDLKPVSCWLEEGRYQICIAPVLVCTKVKQTAGGGDNISAAGLVLQI